ncbi:MOG interacting and ectopic P-granules protein 1-like [Pollicipes pollicipes]|uniref:MOG interacting and ectopic P-granules protein 1-like n=1 Tax=Pollicipes pollicipes TaxID=41117 RepID=UPI0018858173|nr:MOG interacting and ectopic P-granules protein 1-like [Pollicipes pollicipes]
MGDSEAEVNGDAHLLKEHSKGGEEAMDAEEDVGDAEEDEEAEDEEDEDPFADSSGETPSKGAAGEPMETEENGELAEEDEEDGDEEEDAASGAEDGNRQAARDDGDVVDGERGSGDESKESSGSKASNDSKDAVDAADEDAERVKGDKNSKDDAEAEPDRATDDDTKGSSNDAGNDASSGAKPTEEPMEADEAAALSSDSDIEEIEPPDPLAGDAPAAPAAAPAGAARDGARDNSRLVIIDTEALMAGRAASGAVSRPPPLTRAPPPPQPSHGQPVLINPSVMSALAQYGINTAGMTGEQLQQLQDYYRRSHDDAEFVLEAPSFIVPYVMESPPEETVKQFMARVSKAAKVNGEAGGEVDEASNEADRKEPGEAKLEKEVDSNKENQPDKEAAAKREEDFSHLGKWAYYYQGPVGQLLLDQGRGIVEEFIKEDLLKQQKRKAAHEKGGGSEATRFAIKSLTANLAASRRKNAPFRLKLTQCRYCAFETESVLVMERHLEMPHMVGSIYQCNFCDFETRSPQVVLSHMAVEHSVQGRLERAPASFQCPLCPYEDSGKARMTRHLNSCQKKFRIDKNQGLDDWVPPAKVPKIHRGRPNVLGKQFEPVRGGGPGAKALPQALAAAAAAANARSRGRPIGSYKETVPTSVPPRAQFNRQAAFIAASAGMTPQMIRSPTGPQMIMPPHYQIGNQIYQLVNNQLVLVNPAAARAAGGGSGSGVHIVPSSAPSGPPGLSIQATSSAKTVAAAALKLSSTPSISITPVPRPSLPPSVPSILRSAAAGSQLSITKGTVGGRPDAAALSKGAFVICEICDGYIKDLEQLRNHMQWIHKVKIHPKMIYNRPPLNCQKCQLRFFTDQGLERHLLGSHGLVTSSMQEAANKGHDSGRCPICGKVYQWKLLHHVSKDHHVTLKPAHLSYKCTVCTATFSMYKQFENHVYSSHSVVAKKIMESSDRKKAAAAAAASGQPIKINDEITIIPHPGGAPAGPPQAASTPQKRRRAAPAPAVERECELCEHRALPAALLEHYRRDHLGRPEVEFTPLLADPDCAEFVTEDVRRQLREHAAAAARGEVEVEVSDPEDGEEASAPAGAGSGGSALSKLNREITITPIGGASRPRRTPSLVELSDSEQAPADTTVDLAEGEEAGSGAE